MQISTINIAARVLPEGIMDQISPALGKVDAMLFDNSDDSVSRRTAMIAFSIRVVSAAFAYISQVLMARWMGTFEYGIFVAVWVASVIIGGLACLGFQTAPIRFISEYRETGDEEKLRGIIFASLIFSFFSATVIAALGLLALYSGYDFVTNYYIMPIFLAAVCLPLLALSEAQDGVARAFNLPLVALAPTFLLRPVLILVFMGIAVALGFAPDAITAMSATIIAAFAATAYQFFGLLKGLRKEVPVGPKQYLPRQWLLVALPIFLVEGFYNLLTNTDILFVSYFQNPEEVGIYFAAVKTLALVHFVYFAVKAATAHRFSQYLAAGDQVRYEAYIRKTLSWVFWPSFFLAVVMALTGKYFLLLFGTEFADQSQLIWILCLGIVIRSSVGPAESILTMSGKQNSCAKVYGCAFVINLIFNTILIPIYGLNGAAFATTLAMVGESALLYFATKRNLGLHVFIIPKKQVETV